MRREPTIYLDYDNTMVASFLAWLAWGNQRFDTSYSTRDVKAHHGVRLLLGEEAQQYWHSGHTYSEIEPIHGATRFFQRLQQRFTVKFLTMKMPLHICPEKYAHASRIFRIKQPQMIHVPEPFLKHLYTKDGILVDDCPDFVADHVRLNNKPGVVFNHQNRYGWTKRVDHRLCHYSTNYDHLFQCLIRLAAVYR